MSSPFSRADVARIAALARLELTDEELDLYARQLGGILDYAERIQEVITTCTSAPRSRKRRTRSGLL